MDIGIQKIPYKFKDYPLVVGGKAMEYYGLRKAGNDIDLILSERDFTELLKILPENTGKMDMDSYIKFDNFEMWKSIRQFGHIFYNYQSIPMNGFSVISIERLVWLKALYVSEKKSIRDLELISKYVMQKQYKQYHKNNACNKNSNEMML